MPVHDHAIHPSVVHGDDYRYGCHSKRNPPKKAPGYWVKVRDYNPDGTYEMVDKFILHNMSVKCRFYQRKDDLNCRGCEHESDIEYLKGYGL